MQKFIVKSILTPTTNSLYYHVFQIWHGIDAVGIGRRTISELITELALPGSIRGDCCIHVGRNVVHGADNQEEAEMDILLWFNN